MLLRESRCGESDIPSACICSDFLSLHSCLQRDTSRHDRAKLWALPQHGVARWRQVNWQSDEAIHTICIHALQSPFWECRESYKPAAGVPDREDQPQTARHWCDPDSQCSSCAQPPAAAAFLAPAAVSALVHFCKFFQPIPALFLEVVTREAHAINWVSD